MESTVIKQKKIMMLEISIAVILGEIVTGGRHKEKLWVSGNVP